MSTNTEAPGFRRALTYFDLTNMTVGAIVGADIYICFDTGLTPDSPAIWPSRFG